MTKLLYWLGAIAVFAFYGFSEHAVPATAPLPPTQSPVAEIFDAVNTEINMRHLYRNVTRHQMMEGNNCIESERKECEVYR